MAVAPRELGTALIPVGIGAASTQSVPSARFASAPTFRGSDAAAVLALAGFADEGVGGEGGEDVVDGVSLRTQTPWTHRAE